MNTIRNAKGEGSFTRNPDGTITHRKVLAGNRMEEEKH